MCLNNSCDTNTCYCGVKHDNDYIDINSITKYMLQEKIHLIDKVSIRVILNVPNVFNAFDTLN